MFLFDVDHLVYVTYTFENDIMKMVFITTHNVILTYIQENRLTDQNTCSENIKKTKISRIHI